MSVVTTLTTKQLTQAVLDLQLQIQQLNAAPPASSIAAITQEYESKFANVISDYEQKFVEMRTLYNRKIEDLELKLSAAANAASKATLGAVTEFYKTLDEKVDKHMLNIDMISDTVHQHKQTLDGLTSSLSQFKSRFNEHEDLREGAKKEITTESTNYSVSSNKDITMASLEARLDKLEDFSRRDNLLFTGIAENSNEQCENIIRDILARKLLNGVCNANNIVIVRAHCLGRFKSGQTRPIIVKFREFSDKQMILQEVFKGKLINSGLWVTEDFSVNTTNDRKYLRTHLNAAKDVLKGVIKTSSVRYKAIHITNTKGKRFVFPLHKVVSNSQEWWKIVDSGEVSDIEVT